MSDEQLGEINRRLADLERREAEVERLLEALPHTPEIRARLRAIDRRDLIMAALATPAATRVATLLLLDDDARREALDMLGSLGTFRAAIAGLSQPDISRLLVALPPKIAATHSIMLSPAERFVRITVVAKASKALPDLFQGGSRMFEANALEKRRSKDPQLERELHDGDLRLVEVGDAEGRAMTAAMWRNGDPVPPIAPIPMEAAT